MQWKQKFNELGIPSTALTMSCYEPTEKRVKKTIADSHQTIEISV